MPRKTGGQIFINYRTDDTGPVAKHLAADLKRLFGDDAVFLDHERLEAGQPWPAELRDAVVKSVVVLALIGGRWLTLQGAHGIRRLDEEQDWVRQEIEAALTAGKVVIPIFVDGATPPPEAAFTTIPSVKPLSTLQGPSLRTKDWVVDVEAIATMVEKHGLRRLSEKTGAAQSRRTPFFSTIPARGEAPFVGRETDLQYIDSLLAEPTQCHFVALVGPPGVGKSELAFEYARRFGNKYPGGTFLVDLSTSGPPPDIARLGVNVLHLDFAKDLSLDDQCEQTLLSLCSEPTLLVFDNPTNPEQAERWLPRASAQCHVLAASTAQGWSDRWRRVSVQPLLPADARSLAEQYAGTQVPADVVDAVVSQAEGLPVHLTAGARAARREVEHGRGNVGTGPLLRQVAMSFERAWTQLSDKARLVLAGATHFRPEVVPRDRLKNTFIGGLEWHSSDFEAALDECLDLTLLEGTENLRGHQLLWQFVGSRIGDLDAAVSTLLSNVIADEFIAAASRVSKSPADSDAGAGFLAFRTDVVAWPDRSRTSGGQVGDWLTVGEALTSIGRFLEARPWFERAVDEAERGDEHGGVEHQSLGASLHEVGFCHSSLGQFDAALPWFERAVAEKERGDEQGRVDYSSLGKSVHQVGYCNSGLGQFEAARPWFERAVVEKERGDGQGLVDHESVGKSVHQVGYCHSSLGQFELARTWSERAVTEKERGDAHGRVNHSSLALSVHLVGFCLSSVGKYEAARPWFERAVSEAELGDLHGRVNHEKLGASVHSVGDCLSSLNQFEAARPWFERAVAEAERGDIHGRVDHASLGKSMHQVGYCHSSLRQFEAARPWFERAVAEAELGDVHGRVDHESVGSSLHLLAYCHASLGQFSAALPRFERAVAETERGDVHGRVDHESLSKSVHLVGSCHASLRQFESARPWFERAVAEAELGDVHGRVDHDSVGRSVHEVGVCYSTLGQFEAAWPLYERAVAEKERGDVHGRIDHASVDKSVRALKGCLEKLGPPDQASQ